MLVSGPVILDKGKILLLRDEKDDFYKLPGGQLDKGESMEEACKRNVKEKIGLDVKIGKLLCVNVLWQNPTTKERETIVLFSFLAKLRNKNLKLRKDIKEVRWFNLKEIKKGKEKAKISPNTMFAIGFL